MKPVPALTVCILAALTMATASAETRLVTDAEQASFHAHYQQQFPGLAPAKPVFTVTRTNPKAPWTISATVDSTPQRGVRALCRMKRSDFSFDGRWSGAVKARPYAWLERPGCTKIPYAIELLQQMPDTEVASLLEHQTEMMFTARILLGGNTSCASQRAYRFVLHQLDVGTVGSNPEVLAGLVFKSDHATFATVWVKRTGLDYNAWNVSCR
ncbi:MAG: hypothetical protein V4631_18475 [Pseudomonadota bacterium]